MYVPLSGQNSGQEGEMASLGVFQLQSHSSIGLGFECRPLSKIISKLSLSEIFGSVGI